MANHRLPKEHIEALEKILGVKLPAEGFTLEIRPLTAEDEIDDEALGAVVGGANTEVAKKAAPTPQANLPKKAMGGVDVNKWLAKI